MELLLYPVIFYIAKGFVLKHRWRAKRTRVLEHEQLVGNAPT